MMQTWRRWWWSDHQVLS